MIDRMRADGRAHRRLGDAVGQPRLRPTASARPTPSPSACTGGRRPTTPRALWAGHFVRGRDGGPHVGRWWMGIGSPVDFTSPAARRWWQKQARPVLEMGVEGIKADDGEGYYIPPDARFADGRTRRRGRPGPTATSTGARCRRCSTRSTRTPACSSAAAAGAASRRPGSPGAATRSSDFWSLRTLVAATLTAAASGFSNWSHDVGGYLGKRLVERCPRELLLRWVQFGCFTPLMQAHGRFEQEAWRYDDRTLDDLPRATCSCTSASSPTSAPRRRPRARSRPADHPPAGAHRPRRRARLAARRRLRLRAGALGRAGARGGRRASAAS